MFKTGIRLLAQKTKILPQNWNIALFLKIGLDFKQQYLRFYWTDLAEILHASRKNAYFSSPKILWRSVNLFGVNATSKLFFWKKCVFLWGTLKNQTCTPSSLLQHKKLTLYPNFQAFFQRCHDLFFYSF